MTFSERVVKIALSIPKGKVTTYGRIAGTAGTGPMYYVYIIQCKDRSFYTGITTDIERRIKEHNSSRLGAKYTQGRRPVRLVYVKEFPDRSEASKEEARLKSLTREEKIDHIMNARKEYLAQRRLVRKKENEHYLEYKEEAMVKILSDLERINKYYKYKYQKVTIRNQKTRWGSCSKKKNLNFSYRLLDVSKEEREYVIVHELCHLAEMNHSKDFWRLVALQCPDYKKYRAQLKARAR